MDAATQAAQIYDPQQQAEQATAGASHTNTLSDLAQSEKAIDPTFATTFNNASQARAGEAAHTDFNYSTALDGNMSGLHDNQTAMEGSKYQQLVKQISDEQAAAHEGVRSKVNNENTSYGALMSSLAGKYSGLKAGFQADALTKAQDRAFQEKMANAANATQMAVAKSYGGGGAATPSVDQQLATLFQDYVPASHGGKAGYTEAHVIPALMAANPGMTNQTARNLVFPFRKQVFNE